MIKPVSFLAALEGVTEHWSPKVVGRVNDQYVKVAKVRGELAWHKHDDEDELFQVVRGRLRIQFEGGAETVLEAGELRGAARRAAQPGRRRGVLDRAD